MISTKEKRRLSSPKLTQSKCSSLHFKDVLCLILSAPSAPCFVQQLSVELITHIFARLDPISLAMAAKVCTYWRHIVNDDSCCK